MDKQALIDMAWAVKSLDSASLNVALRRLELNDFLFVRQAIPICNAIENEEMERAKIALSEMRAEWHVALDHWLTLDDFTKPQGTEDTMTPEDVRTIKRQSGLTWRELAEAIGYSRSMLYALANGQRQASPRLENALKHFAEKEGNNAAYSLTILHL